MRVRGGAEDRKREAAPHEGGEGVPRDGRGASGSIPWETGFPEY